MPSFSLSRVQTKRWNQDLRVENWLRFGMQPPVIRDAAFLILSSFSIYSCPRQHSRLPITNILLPILLLLSIPKTDQSWIASHITHHWNSLEQVIIRQHFVICLRYPKRFYGPVIFWRFRHPLRWRLVVSFRPSLSILGQCNMIIPQLGGLEHLDFFPYLGEFHHPSWLIYVSMGYVNHQPVMGLGKSVNGNDLTATEPWEWRNCVVSRGDYPQSRPNKSGQWSIVTNPDGWFLFCEINFWLKTATNLSDRYDYRYDCGKWNRYDILETLQSSPRSQKRRHCCNGKHPV